ncbi:hypothetical protein G5I_00857 [Acromyrmex echinatior]|uniref:Uncharacterized protein n=1 Tax=Acromyrmex echinatior TaxID=103372 RepID=F4W606_ACREC|nr:hypothetical protein G5I_00857 [Acromyrmex echinatior]
MTIPTFVDLQGFIIGKKLVVKEVAVLRKGAILSHYIFTCPMPWNFLTKKTVNVRRSCATLVSAVAHHGLQWCNFKPIVEPLKQIVENTANESQDGMISYSMVKCLITMAVIDEEENDNKALIYVKGREKCEWLG